LVASFFIFINFSIALALWKVFYIKVAKGGFVRPTGDK